MKISIWLEVFVKQYRVGSTR